MTRPRLLLLALALLSFPALAPLGALPAQAQRFSIDDVLSPGYPVQLVSARAADRIAWIEYEEGKRNVYTAVAPDFVPERLTRFEDDDGRDLSSLRISDDGSTLVFLRGHTPNRQGWIANPASDPRGAERAAWAVSTAGGEPWRVAEAWNVALSPDGHWIAWESDGDIYRAPVNPGVATGDPERPLFSVFGSQSDPGRLHPQAGAALRRAGGAGGRHRGQSGRRQRHRRHLARRDDRGPLRRRVRLLHLGR